MNQMLRRELSAGETAILTIIQQAYGARNALDEVFFTDQDQAVIFVKAADGTMRLMANLTNLAAWRADGTIQNDEELRTNWLGIRSA